MNNTETSTKNITELVFILDRSGSMEGLEDDTIGGFNSLVEKQKREEGICLVSTVLFDDKVETVHDRVALGEIRPMTRDDYYVRGCTALIDALGLTIEHIATIHKYARPEDRPGHTMFVITTDGMENASHTYSSDKVKKMIEEKKALGWEFVFIGANIDAVNTAANYGIDSSRAVNYHADKEGTRVVFNSLAQLVTDVRKEKCVEATWCEDIKKDYDGRKKKKS